VTSCERSPGYRSRLVERTSAAATQHGDVGGGQLARYGHRTADRAHHQAPLWREGHRLAPMALFPLHQAGKQATEATGVGLASLVQGQPVRIDLPDLRPRCGLAESGKGRGRYAAPRTTIPRERWPEVREHAQRSGLRATARVFGVSHEAVRRIVLRG
jgi:hypothetical protein